MFSRVHVACNHHELYTSRVQTLPRVRGGSYTGSLVNFLPKVRNIKGVRVRYDLSLSCCLGLCALRRLMLGCDYGCHLVWVGASRSKRFRFIYDEKAFIINDCLHHIVKYTLDAIFHIH